MQYEKLEEFVSKPRLDRYLVCCANDKERAKQLYEANLLVAQAFYPVLNLLETFLRNSINDRLTIYYNDTAWIINQKAGFMTDITLAPKYWIRTQVINAENNTRGTITPGKIVSEQTFGFWTSLFEPRHYRLVSGYVIHCFPNKPPAVNRNTIANMLKDIREFRNRIYHNEAICFHNITVNFTHSISIQTQIYDLLKWMDADLESYVKQFDNIDSTIVHALEI